MTRMRRLISTQVLHIYMYKLQLLHASTFKACLQDVDSRLKGQSKWFAPMFGVSSKTVRDIWNRRTWTQTTGVLWAQEDVLRGALPLFPSATPRPRGRPKGSRDIKPRVRRQSARRKFHDPFHDDWPYW